MTSLLNKGWTRRQRKADNAPEYSWAVTVTNSKNREGGFKMSEDVFPIGTGPSLNELTEMEGTYAFQCADCSEIFDTVVQWVQHALDRHSEILPGIEPVRKQ